MTTNLTVSLLWWQLWTGNSKKKRYTGWSIKNDDSVPRRKFWMVKSDNYVWRALESVLQRHADNFFPCILLKGNHDSSRSILNWKNQESKFRNDMLVQINSNCTRSGMIGLYIFNLTLISLLFLYHVILVCILLKWKVESELEKNGILVRPLGRWGTTLTQVPPPGLWARSCYILLTGGHFLVVLRWCYTSRSATTIFSATQHFNIVATLSQHCYAVLRSKSW